MALRLKHVVLSPDRPNQEPMVLSVCKHCQSGCHDLPATFDCSSHNLQVIAGSGVDLCGCTMFRFSAFRTVGTGGVRTALQLAGRV